MTTKARVLDLFRLSWGEYFADFLITPPLTVAFTVLSIRAEFSWAWVALFAVGFLAWTFYEYALHRWLLHKAWFLRDFHELHHSRQTDYIAVHPAVTLALYGFFWFAFGARSSAMMCGFSTGYVVYSVLHTAFHYCTIRVGSPLYASKRRHALHHRFDNANFGVTTALWDRLLKTEASL